MEVPMRKVCLVVWFSIVLAGPFLAGDVTNPKLPVRPEVTIVNPSGGEAWAPGKEISIIYSFNVAVDHHYLKLYSNNKFVGWITSDFIPYAPGQRITRKWRVGHVSSDGYPEHMITAPPGDHYKIGFSIISWDQPALAYSNTFAIIDVKAIFERNK